jgi:hypothetical protein
VYVVIVAPPSDPGAVNVTVAVVEPVAVAVPTVGAFGAVAALTARVTVAVELPVEFVAVTVYEVEVEVAVGVPEKIPVLVEKLIPAGTLGETE